VNRLGEHARLVADALAAGGVRQVVVSPGSRSTPFLHALVEHEALEVHDVLDERAAGFFALGRAKVEGRPVALLCTSGSAPAHYFPAVIEAAAARVPLVVLSADRPPSLHGCGANQTVDQARLYGEHARWFVDLPLPGERPDELRALRRIVVQAVFRSQHPEPGPVHLNARADKPLEPGPAEGDRDRELERMAETVRAEPVTQPRAPRLVPDEATVAELCERIDRAERGMVVAGPAPLSQREHAGAVLALSERAGLALAAEATSQLRFLGDARGRVATLDGFGVLASLDPSPLDVDFVLQLGAAPVSSGWDAWLRRSPRVPRVVVSPWAWPDPQSSATTLVQADVGATLAACLERLERTTAPRALPALGAFDLGSVPLDAMAEGAVTRAVVEALPPGGLLAVGNSLAVRHLDDWCPGSMADLRVWSQRGVAGIDGLVSGAAGAACADGGPTALLLGDLSLLHDLSGLDVARRVRAPFAVVVLDNQGGRIFEQLPVARAPATAPHIDRWTTPHGIESFEHAARLFGHRFARVTELGELRGAMREALATSGCTVVQAVVPPHGAARDRERLRRHLAAAAREGT